MLTKPEDKLTVASVEKELDDLETYYKARRKKLRALLGVLKEEAGSTEAKGENANAGQ